MKNHANDEKESSLVNNSKHEESHPDNNVCFDLSQEHRNDVFLKLKNLYENEIFSDVKIVVGEKTFSVHKLLLVSSIPYFHSMFTHNVIEKKQDIIMLKDMDPDAVGDIVNFVYTSKVNINQKNVQTLLRVSTILQVSLIQQKCSEFLENQLDPTNCLGIYAFAELHGCLQLKMKAKNFCDRHFSKVVKEEEYLSLPYERVKWFLQQNELCIRSEKEVFSAAISWLKEKENERCHLLPSLLSLVRLHFLPKKFIQLQMDTNTLITNDTYSVDMLRTAIDEIESNVIPVKQRTPYGNTVIFCMGGYNKKAFASYEFYNPETEEWKKLGSMPQPKSGAAAIFVGGLLYLIGGRISSLLDTSSHDSNTVDVYDPYNHMWFNVAKLTVPRHRLGVCSIDGTIYAVGGCDGIINLNSVEKYDAELDQWIEVASMSICRMGVGVAVLDGLLYAVGGYDSENRLRSVECYNPETDEWRNVTSMNTPRSGAGVIALNGHVYAVGGYNGVTQLCSVERYCPCEDRWSLITPMNEHRSALSVAVCSNKLFALGGYNGERFLDSVEVYDPESGEWRMMPPMLDSRSGAGVAVGNIPIT